MELEIVTPGGLHHRASDLFAHRGGLHLRAGFGASPGTQGIFDALDAMQRPCTPAVWRRSWRVKQCLLQLVCFSVCPLLCPGCVVLLLPSRQPEGRQEAPHLAVLPVASACTRAAALNLAASGSIMSARAEQFVFL